jgi:hypothetical protein
LHAPCHRDALLQAQAQAAPLAKAEDQIEDNFHIVHAVTEAGGTSFDEKLLIAVRACNRADVQTLLTEGATLHEMAKATNLTAEMKEVVGESLAALYSAQALHSAQCDTPSTSASCKGSFINTSAPIAQLVHGQDVLSLLHADGSLSEWRSERKYNRLHAQYYLFELNKTTNYAQDSVVSFCGKPTRAYGLKTPYRATCSKAGTVTTWSTAGVALDTSACTNIDNIQTVPNEREYSDGFIMIGTSVNNGIIHLWDLQNKQRVTIHTGTGTNLTRLALCAYMYHHAIYLYDIKLCYCYAYVYIACMSVV